MDESIDCGRIHRELRESGGKLAAAFEEQSAGHLSECPACAELCRDQGALARFLDGQTNGESDGETAGAASDPAFESESFARTLAALESEIQPPAGMLEALRQRSTLSRGLALGGLSLVLSVLVFAFKPRIDFGEFPRPRMWISVLTLLAAGVAAGSVVLRPVHRRRLPDWALGVVAFVAFVVPASIAVMSPAHVAHPASLGGTGSQLFARALPCFLFGGGLASLLIFATWVIERSGLRKRANALLAFLGAGALGNLLLLLHCPLVAPTHKLAGHATVSVVLGLLGLGLVSFVGYERGK